LDVNSTTRAAGQTAAQERTGISGNVDNSRDLELAETPVEGVLTTLGLPAIAGMPTNSRGQNNSWVPKNTNDRNKIAKSRVDSNSRGNRSIRVRKISRDASNNTNPIVRTPTTAKSQKT
jgi:hypothetical protein